jgi:hypothetical protein
MMGGGQTQQQPDDIPIMMRYFARGVGAIGGVLAIIMGVIACLTTTPLCIVAGIWQMCAGFIVAIMEAPCCCIFIDFAQQFGTWADQRSYWQKGAVYLLLSLPSVLMCREFSIFIGSGLVFVTAVLYGMFALGKKAPREDMILRATSTSDVTLVDNMETGKPTPATTARIT